MGRIYIFCMINTLLPNCTALIHSYMIQRHIVSNLGLNKMSLAKPYHRYGKVLELNLCGQWITAIEEAIGTLTYYTTISSFQVDQLPRLGKRELICLLLFTCNYVVYVWRGFFFLWVLGMGYIILLWHSLSLPYNYFVCVEVLRPSKQQDYVEVCPFHSCSHQEQASPSRHCISVHFTMVIEN